MRVQSDSSYNNQLTSSQCLEVKLFLDKIPYFDGSNNKEALNFLAQCKEAAEKIKASEVTIAWSKLAGRADRIMREETRQHEGTLMWELFQSMLIEHFYHIPSKERAASLLKKLQHACIASMPIPSICSVISRSFPVCAVFQ